VNDAERTADKKRLFEELLQTGIGALHLDPRAPDASVPTRFARQTLLVLNFSWNFHIADFRIGDDVVEATLTFGGQPWFCRVPWYAVFAVTNDQRDQGMVWPEDLPPEHGGPARTWTGPMLASGATTPRGKPKLRVLRDREEAPAEPESSSPAASQSAPGPAAAASGPAAKGKLVALRAAPAEAEPVAPAAAGSDAEVPPAPPPPKPGSHLRRIK
jgi:stringent starvation protein B